MKRVVKAKKSQSRTANKETAMKKRSSPGVSALKSKPSPVPEENSVEFLQAQVQSIRRKLNILHAGLAKLTGAFSSVQVLQMLTAATADFFQVGAAACLVWERRREVMVTRAAVGFGSPGTPVLTLDPAKLKPIWEDREEKMLLSEADLKERFDPAWLAKEKVSGAIAWPLRFDHRRLGVLLVFGRDRPLDFSPEEILEAEIFVKQLSWAIWNADLYHEMREEAQIAQTLLEVAENVGSLDSLDQILDRIAIIVNRALTFKVSLLFLWDRERKVYLPVKAVGLPPYRSHLFETLVLRPEELNFSEGELRARSVISADQAPGRFPMEKLSEVLEVRDLRLVPLITKGKLLGVIAAGGYFGQEPLDEKDELFFRGIAAQAAIAIDDANLFKDLESSFWDIIQSLAAAIEAKDRYTHSHSQAVSLYAMALAKEMELPGKESDLLRKACLLHDLGKIGVEDGILRKISPLTPEERKAIEQHPVIGASILAAVTSLREVARIVRFHHEHFNGQGYPDHLKGEEIPLLARILHIVDAFDAMTSDRPYRKALSREEAVAQLKMHSGVQFDPALVQMFLRVLNRIELYSPPIPAGLP